MTCENCPNFLVEHMARRKETARERVDCVASQLALCSWKDRWLTLRTSNLKLELSVAKEVLKDVEQSLPDEVEDAIDTCSGPYQRRTETADGRVYLDQICGAWVRDHVSSSRIDDLDLFDASDDSAAND